MRKLPGFLGQQIQALLRISSISQTSPFALTFTKKNLLSNELECKERLCICRCWDIPAIVEILFSRASLQAVLVKGSFTVVTSTFQDALFFSSVGGYRVREQHVHSLCPRCSHRGRRLTD